MLIPRGGSSLALFWSSCLNSSLAYDLVRDIIGMKCSLAYDLVLLQRVGPRRLTSCLPRSTTGSSGQRAEVRSSSSDVQSCATLPPFLPGLDAQKEGNYAPGGCLLPPFSGLWWCRSYLVIPSGIFWSFRDRQRAQLQSLVSRVLPASLKD